MSGLWNKLKSFICSILRCIKAKVETEEDVKGELKKRGNNYDGHFFKIFSIVKLSLVPHIDDIYYCSTHSIIIITGYTTIPTEAVRAAKATTQFLFDIHTHITQVGKNGKMGPWSWYRKV